LSLIKQMNLLRLQTDPDPELTVIDLGLLARPRLKAHRRELRPPTLIAVRPDKSLHLHQAAGKTQSLQLAVQHDAIEADFPCAPFDKLGEPIQLTRSTLWSPRLPLAQPQPSRAYFDYSRRLVSKPARDPQNRRRRRREPAGRYRRSCSALVTLLAQGTRWRAAPNARGVKNQTITISSQIKSRRNHEPKVAQF
jgi:transposase